jgi:regulator of sigma E protease
MHPELANLLGQLSFNAAVQEWVKYGYLLLLVVIGFSVIIFVHELGHFLAAKWMGVRVDRFAVGFFYRVCGYRRGEGFTFGPRPAYKPEELVTKGYGETDYCLNALPFGGYVKMLGEDDIQINDETGEVTRSSDPRAFTNKPVGRRMVVVSAGVVFNAVFAVLLYAFVYLAVGKNMLAPVLGLIEPNSPAASAGLLPGDRVLAINGVRVHSYDDVFMGSVLSREPLHFKVERGGKLLPKELVFEPPPRRSGDGPAQLFAPMTSTVVDSDIVSVPDAQGLKPGDRVVQVNGQPVENLWQIIVAFQACRGAPVEFSIARPNPQQPGSSETLTLWQQPDLVFLPPGGGDSGKPASGENQNLLGMIRRTVVGFVERGMPAGQAGFKCNDVIVQWGTVANPLSADVSQSTEANEGVPIPVIVERGGELVSLSVSPRRAFSPLGTAVPRVGLGFRSEDARPVVADVMADTPAAALGMPRGAELLAVNERTVRNWFDVFEALRAAAGETVAVRYRSGADEVVGHMRVPSSIVNELNLPPTAQISSINGEDSVTLDSGKKAALPAPFAVQKLLERFIGRTVSV